MKAFVPIVFIFGVIFAASIIFLLARSARNMATMLVYPERTEVKGSPASAGIESWENVKFQSGDLQLEGWFIPPSPEADGATMIFVHGWGGNRAALLSRAAAINGFGYGALLFDLRNSGSSGGQASTWGYLEADDVQSAYAYLITRPDVNLEKIGLYGFSTGGAAVSRAAAQNHEIKAVVIESTYTALIDNLPNVIGLLKGRIPVFTPLVLWFAERESGVPLREIKPVEDVARIAPTPTMLIYGVDDIVVDLSHGQRLFEAVVGPKKLYIAPNAGHGEVFSTDPVKFEDQLGAFLNQYLR